MGALTIALILVSAYVLWAWCRDYARMPHAIKHLTCPTCHGWAR